MSVVVTAAAGHLGGLVVRSLLDRGVAAGDIIATGRSLDRLAALRDRGVRVAEFDYANPAADVIGPGDTVLLISGTEVGQRVEQHRNVIEAAKAAGAARVVYTSATRADHTSLVLAPDHAATEAILQGSGLVYTILRDGWYHENYEPTFRQARQTGGVLTSAGDGRVSSAARADYAEAAAVVLATDGHDNTVYELGGDTAWTMRDLADIFSEVLGRPIALRSVSSAEHRALLLEAGLDEATAGIVTAMDKNTADDTLLVTSGDLSRLIGRPTTPIADAVRSWSQNS